MFQRAVYDATKEHAPEASTYEIKASIGQQWRDMPDSEKLPYRKLAQQTNRQLRQRMAFADPQELLVRHKI